MNVYQEALDAYDAWVSVRSADTFDDFLLACEAVEYGCAGKTALAPNRLVRTAWSGWEDREKETWLVVQLRAKEGSRRTTREASLLALASERYATKSLTPETWALLRAVTCGVLHAYPPMIEEVSAASAAAILAHWCEKTGENFSPEEVKKMGVFEYLGYALVYKTHNNKWFVVVGY